MKIIKCNFCGKEFNNNNNQEMIKFHKYIGYGSEYDGEQLNLDLCYDCFDKLINELIPRCIYNPFTD